MIDYTEMLLVYAAGTAPECIGNKIEHYSFETVTYEKAAHYFNDFTARFFLQNIKDNYALGR